MRIVYGIFLFVLVAGPSRAYSPWRRDEIVGFPDEPKVEDSAEEPAPAPEPTRSEPDDNDVIKHGDTSESDSEESEQTTTGDVDQEEQTNEVSQTAECEHQELELYLEQLANNTGIDIYLKVMAAIGQPVPFESADEWFELFAAYTGYDLRKHSGRHTLACDLTHIDDLDGLALFFHAPKTMVVPIYESVMEQWHDMGGMRTLSVIVFIGYSFSTWLVESGYPNIPLKKEYRYDDVRDMMKSFQSLAFATSDEDGAGEFLEAMSGTLMPIQYLPEYSARIITGSTTRDEVAQHLCINPTMLKLFDQYGSPEQLTEQTNLMLIIYRIISELDDLGLFDLTDKDV